MAAGALRAMVAARGHKLPQRLLTSVLAVLPLLLAPAGPAASEDLIVHDGYIGWVPGRLPSRAYFKLTNNGRRPITLVGARSPHFARIEFKAPPDNDLFILEPLDMPQVVAPGQTLEFRPDGAYLLLLVQSDWMEPGDTATITLLFDDRDPFEFELTVRK